MLYGHGDDIYGQRLKANFSSNVPQSKYTEQLMAFWGEHLGTFVSYPEPNASSFVATLASAYHLQNTQICATHGATEAIYLIAQVFAGKTSVILEPTFAEYEDACRIHQHKLSFFKVLEELAPMPSELVWLCNPNNPTGQSFDKDKLLQIIDEQKDKVFVIDQTYRYFTLNPPIGYQEAICRSNLILIDSFTKRYAVPGLRLGYIVAHKDMIKRISNIKPPWSVNQLAIETGKYLLSNPKLLPLDLPALLAETKELQAALKVLPNIKVYPSNTHFFLCQLYGTFAKTCKVYLLERYGLLIRNAENFRGLSPYFIRIATQDRGSNQILIEAMTCFLNVAKSKQTLKCNINT